MGREMKYEINIDPQEVDTDYMDEWGAAFLWLDDERGVEYNLCYDSGECESAIYKTEMNYKDRDYPDGYMETDSSTFEPYEIDFNDENWKEKLVNAMEKIAKDFFKGGN